MTVQFFKNKWRCTFFHFTLLASLKLWRRGSSCILIFTFSIFSTAYAATPNIDATNHWAWNDIVGWIDFYTPKTVTVLSANLTGYASSSPGDISLAGGSGSSTYQVINDGNGNLAGWGWNDVYGWISFCGGRQGTFKVSDCPGSQPYETQISGTTGDFSGYAWNDIIGWISFCGSAQSSYGCVQFQFPPCSQLPQDICKYKVNTSWRAVPKTASLDSSTFDTGIPGGAQLNSVLWQGYLPEGGAAVHFQFSASNSSVGPWNFTGPDGTENSDYGPVSANTSFSFTNYALYNNKRYFRYRVVLISDAAQHLTPRVDDIVVNWSP